MRSCICLLYISALAGSAAAQSADALYADRTNLASARRAAEMWTASAASDPRSFDAAWKLARADYWLGNHTGDPEQRAFYENGVTMGQRAAALERDRPDGYFWMAVNMAALAESSGLRGLKYRKPIKEALETVLRLDPAFNQGAADRALGRWYDKVPGLFGGSDKLAEEHLKASLKYNAESTVTHYFLAEFYVDRGRRADARAEAQRVLDAPLTADWAPEDREWKTRARMLLERLK